MVPQVISNTEDFREHSMRVEGEVALLVDHFDIKAHAGGEVMQRRNNPLPPHHR